MLHGYIRWTYKEFFDRYRMLLPWQRVRPSDVRRMCETILTDVIKVGVYDLVTLYVFCSLINDPTYTV